MKIKLQFVIAFLFLAQAILHAQPGNPGSAPIGGVIYLLLAGLGFGVYSLRKKRK